MCLDGKGREPSSPRLLNTRLETRIKEFNNSARHGSLSCHAAMRVIGHDSPDLALALSEVLLMRPERWRSTLDRLEARSTPGGGA